jgi:hypothetical protein
MTIFKTIGQYEMVYTPKLALATVKKGLLFPVVVHEEDDPDAFTKCEAWVKEQLAKG